MTKALAVLTALIAAALLTAPAAQAHRGGNDQLRLRIELPIVFSDPTPTCPGGIAQFGVSFRGQSGSGENCIEDIVPADCPPAVEALFC